jgi:hypothetical protein
MQYNYRRRDGRTKNRVPNDTSTMWFQCALFVKHLAFRAGGHDESAYFTDPNKVLLLMICACISFWISVAILSNAALSSPGL